MKPIEWSGEQILKARHRVGLSQKHFAMLLGVSSGSVCGWETDRITPRPIAIEALNKLAEMSPEVVREKSRIQRMSGKLARTLTGELLSQKKKKSIDSPSVSVVPVDLLAARKIAQWDANRIARLRLRLCITQEHFAEKLNVSVSAVKSWEGDRNLPTGLAFEAVKALEATLPPDDGQDLPGFKKISVRSKFFDELPPLPPLRKGMHQKALIRKADRPRPFKASWEKVSASPLKFLVLVPPRAGKRAGRGDYANVEHDASYCYTQVELIRKVRRTKEGDLWEYNRLFRKNT